MKIKREEVNGVESLITPCWDCLFYIQEKDSCHFDRIEKYKEKGKIQKSDGKTEVTTFCNYARPHEWQNVDDNIQDCIAKVKEENKIKYDLVARIKSHEDIPKVKEFLDSKTPPERVIFSFETDRIKEIIESADKLGCKFELIKIEDIDATEECEFRRVDSPWYQTVNLCEDFSTDIIEQLSIQINDNLNPIVAVICDQPVVMTILAVSLDTVGIKPKPINVLELAKLQKQLEFIRGFDGNSICDYCEP